MAALTAATVPARRIAHTDAGKYHKIQAVHDGAGQLNYMELLDNHSLDTNLFFLHRGVVEPKSGIGHHFHNDCEEMFIIFDGEAQLLLTGGHRCSEVRRVLPAVWATHTPFTTPPTSRSSG